jgi:hypothetical protein
LIIAQASLTIHFRYIISRKWTLRIGSVYAPSIIFNPDDIIYNGDNITRYQPDATWQWNNDNQIMVFS